MASSLAPSTSTSAINTPTTHTLQKTFTIADIGRWLKIAGSIPFEPTVNNIMYYFMHAHVLSTCKSSDTRLSFDISKDFKESYLCEIKSLSFHVECDNEDVFAKLVLGPVDDAETPYWDPVWR